MRFTRNNNPRRKKHPRKNPEASWNFCGSRENYIHTLTEIEAAKLNKEEKKDEKTN